MELCFSQATEADVQEFVRVQNAAFLSDYKKYGLCPGYGRSAESMAESLKSNYTLKITARGEIIGKLSAKPTGGGKYHIGCLCVVPEYQNRGVGKAALSHLESLFPDAREWTLETPADSERNIGFYRACGYEISGTENDGVELVVLTKK